MTTRWTSSSTLLAQESTSFVRSTLSIAARAPRIQARTINWHRMYCLKPVPATWRMQQNTWARTASSSWMSGRSERIGSTYNLIRLYGRNQHKEMRIITNWTSQLRGKNKSCRILWTCNVWEATNAKSATNYLPGRALRTKSSAAATSRTMPPSIAYFRLNIPLNTLRSKKSLRIKRRSWRGTGTVLTRHRTNLCWALRRRLCTTRAKIVCRPPWMIRSTWWRRR